MDESALIQASRAGDKDAFGRLTDKYYKSIYRLAYRYTGSHTEADDICQETFLRAFEKITALRNGESFKAWIFRITINLSHNVFNKINKEKTMDAQNICEIVNDRSMKKVKGPFETLSAREKADIIHKQLRQMPEHMRLVTILILMEGLSQKDAAGILGCSEPSVSRYIAQARGWLRDRLRNLA